MTTTEVARDDGEQGWKKEMPGSGAAARVIKDPEETSRLLWHSMCRPSANHPTRPSREPRRSHAMPREGKSSLGDDIRST
jgi:hypothetical protein